MRKPTEARGCRLGRRGCDPPARSVRLPVRMHDTAGHDATRSLSCGQAVEPLAAPFECRAGRTEAERLVVPRGGVLAQLCAVEQVVLAAAPGAGQCRRSSEGEQQFIERAVHSFACFRFVDSDLSTSGCPPPKGGVGGRTCPRGGWTRVDKVDMGLALRLVERSLLGAGVDEVAMSEQVSECAVERSG